MPSIRLLSMVHEGHRPRLKWIPWQYRLSQKRYQEILEAKSSRAIRSEIHLIKRPFVASGPLAIIIVPLISSIFWSGVSRQWVQTGCDTWQQAEDAAQRAAPGDPTSHSDGPGSRSCVPVSRRGNGPVTAEATDLRARAVTALQSRNSPWEPTAH